MAKSASKKNASIQTDAFKIESRLDDGICFGRYLAKQSEDEVKLDVLVLGTGSVGEAHLEWAQS